MEANQEDSSVWVIVDSDGEDGDDSSLPRTALKESDLIAFLNQVPFPDIFRQVSCRIFCTTECKCFNIILLG